MPKKKTRRGVVKKLERQQLSTINNTVVPFYLEKNPSYHCIIELSAREVKKMKDNTIHLGGLLIINDKQQKMIVTSYNQVQYGKKTENQVQQTNTMSEIDIIK